MTTAVRLNASVMRKWMQVEVEKTNAIEKLLPWNVGILDFHEWAIQFDSRRILMLLVTSRAI